MEMVSKNLFVGFRLKRPSLLVVAMVEAGHQFTIAMSYPDLQAPLGDPCGLTDWAGSLAPGPPALDPVLDALPAEAVSAAGRGRARPQLQADRAGEDLLQLLVPGGNLLQCSVLNHPDKALGNLEQLCNYFL